VLDELTVDLEVRVELRPQDPEHPPGMLLLQEMARARSFVGSFDPETDKRLAGLQARGAADGVDDPSTRGEGVEAVIFEFSNAFSWMTGKEIELVALRVRPSGPPPAKVPPLPACQPLALLPRSTGAENGALDAKAAPELRGAAAELDSTEDGGRELRRFAAHLDTCLAAAEEGCPSNDDGEWLQELRARIVALRGFCQQGPPQAATPGMGGEAEAEATLEGRQSTGLDGKDGGEADPAGVAQEQQLEDKAALESAEAPAAGQPHDGE